MKKYLIYKILQEQIFTENFFKGVDWSSSETSLEKNQKKSDFDNDPVLKRMKIQLQKKLDQNKIY